MSFKTLLFLCSVLVFFNNFSSHIAARYRAAEAKKSTAGLHAVNIVNNVEGHNITIKEDTHDIVKLKPGESKSLDLEEISEEELKDLVLSKAAKKTYKLCVDDCKKHHPVILSKEGLLEGEHNVRGKTVILQLGPDGKLQLVIKKPTS